MGDSFTVKRLGVVWFGGVLVSAALCRSSLLRRDWDFKQPGIRDFWEDEDFLETMP